MSNYVVTTNFAAKDALAHGNAAKVAKGTELSAELNAIAVAVATKEDLANKNVNSGYAGLDATARILKAQAPAVTAYTDAGNVFTVAQIITATTGNGLTVNAVANTYSARINGSATSGQSFGLVVVAGTTAADSPFTVNNQTNARALFSIAGNGALVAGNSTDNPTFTFAGTGQVAVGGSLVATGNVTGSSILGNGANLTNLVATNIATGVILAARTGSGPAAARFLYTSDGVNNVWSTAGFSDLTGAASVAQIPALPASQITSGTFSNSLIAVGNVTQWQSSLTIATTQLSGQVSNAQVPSSAVTQYNSSITGRNISSKAGISKTLQAGGTASGGSDGDIIYIY